MAPLIGRLTALSDGHCIFVCPHPLQTQQFRSERTKAKAESPASTMSASCRYESSSQLYLDGGSDRFDASDDWKACSILGTSTPSGNPLIDTLTMPSTVFPLGSVVFGAGDALISPLS